MDRSLFDQAIAAVEAKQHARARELLMQFVRANPRDEQGWLWLAGVMDDLDKSIDCLQYVLALNPNNSKAKEWLAVAREEKEVEQRLSVADEIPIEEPGDVERPVPRLGKYLLSNNLVSAEQLKLALLAQRQAQQSGQSKRLGDLLVEQGAVTADRLRTAVRKQEQDFYNQFKD